MRYVAALASLVTAGCHLVFPYQPTSDVTRPADLMVLDVLSRDDWSQDRSTDSAVRPDGTKPDGMLPTVCGGPRAVVDSFDGATTDARWQVSGGASQAGGRLVLTPPPGVAGAASYRSRYAVNLKDGVVSVEVPLLSTAAGATAMVAVERGPNNRLSLEQSSGLLACHLTVNGAKSAGLSTVYDATAHRHWRLRESNGWVYCEVSADSKSWSSLRATATPSFASTVFILLEARTIGGATGGAVELDNLNSGPSAPWCKASSFSDDFGNSTLDIPWEPIVKGGCSVGESSGMLCFQLTGPTGRCQVQSATAFELRSSFVKVSVPAITNHRDGMRVFLSLEDSGGGGASLSFVGATTGAGEIETQTSDGTTSNVAKVPYQPSQDQWWRIRETGGTIHFETSVDGTSWHAPYSSPATPFPGLAMRVVIGVEATKPITAAPVPVCVPQYN
jgi:hypothetical protein